MTGCDIAAGGAPNWETWLLGALHIGVHGCWGRSTLVYMAAGGAPHLVTWFLGGVTLGYMAAGDAPH